MDTLRTWRTDDVNLRIRLLKDNGHPRLALSYLYEDRAGRLRTATSYIGQADVAPVREALDLLERLEREGLSTPQPESADAFTGQPEAQKGQAR